MSNLLIFYEKIDLTVKNSILDFLKRITLVVIKVQHFTGSWRNGKRLTSQKKRIAISGHVHSIVNLHGNDYVTRYLCLQRPLIITTDCATIIVTSEVTLCQPNIEAN